MADRPQMFGPTRGFSGWPIQWNHATCCGDDPCCHGNEILANLGYLENAYKSSCMPDRPDMFGPTRGDDQGGGGGDLYCHGNDICARRGV